MDRPATMRSLFQFGASCAQQGRLWTTLDQAMARADKAVAQWQPTRPAAKVPQTPECPLDESAIPTPPPMQQASVARLERK